MNTYKFTKLMIAGDLIFEAEGEKYKFFCNPNGMISILEKNDDSVYVKIEKMNIWEEDWNCLKDPSEKLECKFHEFVNKFGTDVIDDNLDVELDTYVLEYHNPEQAPLSIVLDSIKKTKMHLSKDDYTGLHKWYMIRAEIDGNIVGLIEDTQSFKSPHSDKDVYIYTERDRNVLYIIPAEGCSIDVILEMLVDSINKDMNEMLQSGKSFVIEAENALKKNTEIFKSIK